MVRRAKWLALTATYLMTLLSGPGARAELFGPVEFPVGVVAGDQQRTELVGCVRRHILLDSGSCVTPEVAAGASIRRSLAGAYSVVVAAGDRTWFLYRAAGRGADHARRRRCAFSPENIRGVPGT